MAKREVVLRGLPISKGVGIGAPLFFASPDDSIASISIPRKEVENEIDRYRKALDLSRKEVERLQKLSVEDGPPEIVAILGTHLEMMKDPMMTTAIEERIRETQQNPETIFLRLIEEYKQRFSALQDTYFRERIRDIVDVSRRILGHLSPYPRIRMTDIPHDSILLTQELVPSETIEVSSTSVGAFVTAAGGITSHAAIIARAKGIPYVGGVDIKLLKQYKFGSLIVDGSAGLVILNPSKQTLKKYQTLKRQLLRADQQLQHALSLKGETADGYEVRIFANLENPEEIALLRSYGACGVGLFRSEYLFLTQKRMPTEQEQYEIYKKMAFALKGLPLVIRIFDIGGDKKVDDPTLSEIGHELNPSLGCRAIRLLLRHPKILAAQLRAILRASCHGPIQILVPMVSDLAELRLVRSVIKRLCEELCIPSVPIGCMIEVPSSALMCDAFAKEADFLSIGTNDLTQYVLAADRSNPHTSDLYFSPHPSILRLIHQIVSSAQSARKPLLLCGECAADPTMIPLLIGLGIREFSVSARHIPLVKHTLRKWHILDAQRLAEEALTFTTAADLKHYLAEATRR